MQGLKKYPEACRASIKKAAKILKTDYKDAYFAILLEAVLTDLNPQDPEILELIQQGCG